MSTTRRRLADSANIEINIGRNEPASERALTAGRLVFMVRPIRQFV